ncbi:hypothetical protein CLV84_2233 [Neolewinella xylanilytica]|uniref:Uncharacterized protein n=1 Tax=Neolewinella xylanilytica TaxID=1514080 RepID=A0A2S6I2E8_9BACT|nr:potassium transporter KefB [Neolewinella xylanilytica]PPK85338.1 hypothetical protein CLV84_2233 [Neolewinella xylanilytica]
MSDVATSPVPAHPRRGLGMACLLGACLGFALITTFVFGVDHPNPAWGPDWRVRPLIVAPLAGAAGAGVAYYTFRLLVSWEWPRFLVWLVCGLGLLVALWMGTVVGLDGTMWN